MWRIGLVLLAVLGISAVAPAAASAAACESETGKTKFALCLNAGKELVEGTLKLHIANDPTTPTKAFLFKGSEVELKCPEVSLQLGAMMTAGKTVSLGIRAAGLVFHFIGCTAPKPEHCVVNNGLIITQTLDSTPTAKAEDKKVLVLPENGTLFAYVKIESSGGTCLVAGTDQVTALNGNKGEGLLCNAEDGETTQALHLTECTGTTKLTNLQFAGKEAEFKGNFTTLIENETTTWSVVLGK